MTRGKLIKVAIILALAIGIRWDGKVAGQSQTPPPVIPSFRASVDMVRIAAIVRDRKGRFVADLTARDFEILDGGQTRNIRDFRHDLTGVSVAMLFDVSGSMEGHLKYAREAADHVMSWLDPTRDEAAVFTFDTHLDEVAPFTVGLKALPNGLTGKKPFGETSLHDAIALTAKRVGEREGRRRAVVVLTDGADTASYLKPAEVSAIASGIDVPVYIFGIVPSIDNPSEETAVPAAQQSALVGPLADLAAWTGGHVFVASTDRKSVV